MTPIALTRRREERLTTIGQEVSVNLTNAMESLVCRKIGPIKKRSVRADSKTMCLFERVAEYRELIFFVNGK